MVLSTSTKIAGKKLLELTRTELFKRLYKKGSKTKLSKDWVKPSTQGELYYNKKDLQSYTYTNPKGYQSTKYRLLSPKSGEDYVQVYDKGKLVNIKKKDAIPLYETDPQSGKQHVSHWRKDESTWKKIDKVINPLFQLLASRYPKERFTHKGRLLQRIVNSELAKKGYKDKVSVPSVRKTYFPKFFPRDKAKKIIGTEFEDDLVNYMDEIDPVSKKVRREVNVSF